MRALLLGLFLVACGSEAEFRAELLESDRRYLEKTMSYYYDKSTRLCFAATNLQYNNATLTSVPCSEAVLARCSFIGTFAGMR